jgi:Cyclophilin type peptidyl-prolyl cis-trans isomerase/CLD
MKGTRPRAVLLVVVSPDRRHRWPAATPQSFVAAPQSSAVIQSFLFSSKRESFKKSDKGFQRMSVTIHTTIGDLKVEIFCDTAPRTAFNFLALAASGSYDGTAFHRNIKGFMIQAGDTAEKTGSKGGESIWGAVAFPDEFHPNNIHDRRGVLSMANKGMYSFV